MVDSGMKLSKFFLRVQQRVMQAAPKKSLDINNDISLIFPSYRGAELYFYIEIIALTLLNLPN